MAMFVSLAMSVSVYKYANQIKVNLTYMSCPLFTLHSILHNQSINQSIKLPHGITLISPQKSKNRKIFSSCRILSVSGFFGEGRCWAFKDKLCRWGNENLFFFSLKGVDYGEGGEEGREGVDENGLFLSRPS